MKTSDWQNVLVVGCRNKKIEKIDQILKRYFFKVIQISGLPELSEPILYDKFGLIIITDSWRDMSDADLAPKLRRLYPNSKILGLFDRIDPETERLLRGIGLIFLGSYDLFIEQIATIVGLAENAKRREKNQVAKELGWNGC